MTTLEARVRTRGDAAVIDLSGEINSSAGPTMTAAYDEATASGMRRVVLNFRDVAYINSSGIAVIVGVLARGRAEGVAIQACDLMNHYVEIFQITRLSDFMGIHTDEDDAISTPVAAG